MLGNDKKTSLTQYEFMEAVKAIESYTTINSLMTGSSESVGVKYSFYQHFPPIGAFDFNNSGRFHGYNTPDKFVERYNIENKNDPLIPKAFSTGEPVWLSDAMHEPYVTKVGFEKSIQWALNLFGDGLCCPLFGPDNRKGYAFIGFHRDKSEFDSIMPYQMHALVQTMHIRYCRMVKALQRQVNLTPREAEVLELISYGKTNPDIALILNISPRTVAVHMSKIFIKLDTTDRVSAALRAQTIDIRM